MATVVLRAIAVEDGQYAIALISLPSRHTADFQKHRQGMIAYDSLTTALPWPYQISVP